MYTRCLFCQADLGRNEAIEAFPVGRRLAYDAERGRLWVVCRSCERWNLTPLEQRWEAIDSAERLYRDTRRRAATENIGLAQLNDGTELVRVGRPLRPEFAAWRYGDQFGRRRRRAMATGVAAVGATGAVIVAGPVLGLVSLATVAPLLNVLNLTINGWRVRQSIAVPTEPGRTLRVATNLASVRLLPRGDERWQLEVGGVLPEGERIAHWRRLDLETRSVLLEGDAALRAAGTLLAHVNRAGGGAAAVRDAVALVERTPDPCVPVRAHGRRAAAPLLRALLAVRRGWPDHHLPTRRAPWRSRWRRTRSRSGARSRASSASWSARGRRPSRSPPSPTTCWSRHR
jgi:hypothetical protein